MPSRPLTDRIVRSLKPPATGRRDTYDATMPGLHLRCFASGARSWRFIYRPAGQARQRVVTWPGVLPLADARKLAREAAVAVARGEDPAATRETARRAAQETPTVAWLIEDYLGRYARVHQRPSTTREVERILRRTALPAWGRRLVTEVTRKDVRALLDGIVARGCGPTANRTRAVLHRLFGWAVEVDLLDASPCAGLPRLVKETPRSRVLTDDEIKRLWPWLPPYGRLQLLLGCRGGELAQIRWTDVNPDARTVTFRAETTKSSRARTVPLSTPARALLDGLRATATGTAVFPGEAPDAPRTRGRTDVAAALAAAQILDAHPHDLRRTAATNLGRLGTPELIVRLVLGHARPSAVTGIYDTDPRLDACRAALETWAQRLDQIVTGQPTGAVVVPMRAAR